eukprot:278639_1
MTATVSNSFSFLPYTKPIHEWKYNKRSYYKDILYSYLKETPDATAKSARIALKSETKKNIKNQRIPKLKPHSLIANTYNRSGITYDYIKKGAEQLNELFANFSEDERIILLNQCQNDENKYDLKYGDSIIAAANSKPLLSSLTARFRYNLAQKEKQTIFSSFVSTDDSGNVTNSTFLYDLTNGKINKSLIETIGKLRLKYDNNKSIHLYDPKFDGKYKEYNKAHPDVKHSKAMNDSKTNDSTMDVD